ncbi:putative ATP-binding cassette [Babesia sp. Xinjiang]|uniref:putative ATP-binding cassette n=1 Tax=Babesia sp. Xinjiang TaxID=462227 RepID=UPI000A25534E|nr:putative ATP-binding cassette [Babesia sp. Xinjiang]ORM42070.1 putative ATP-binding cassette [Babesia sp. Xinjiang]
MTIGDVTSLLMYSALVGGSLQSFTTSFADIQKCIGAAVNLAAYIEPDQDRTKRSYVPLKPVAPQVEFNRVSFIYPARPECPILRDVSFVLPAERTLVVLGESGCGKSSILQLLLGLYTPNSGSIYIDGNEMSDIDIKELRSMATLFDDTIRNNVLYGQTGAEDKLVEAYKRSGLLNIMSDLPDGDNTVVGQMGKGLSVITLGLRRMSTSCCAATLKLCLSAESTTNTSDLAFSICFMDSGNNLKLPGVSTTETDLFPKFNDNLLTDCDVCDSTCLPLAKYNNNEVLPPALGPQKTTLALDLFALNEK